MNTRRPMGVMLAEIGEGAMAATARAGLRATRIEMNLPVDVAWSGGELFAELPRSVMRTAFDGPPSRLRLVWETVP